jgi:deazaflavin-dependent oxidoreductase (nitroreductase family)
MNASFIADKIWRWRTFERLYIAIYHLFKGRVFGKHSILLTTRGRKSGKPRKKPLMYVQDGRDFVIIASAGGSDKHPAWYLNLKANPLVSVEDHGLIVPCTASMVEDNAEYERLWMQLLAIYPLYGLYRERTTRKLPIVRLEPESH